MPAGVAQGHLDIPQPSLVPGRGESRCLRGAGLAGRLARAPGRVRCRPEDGEGSLCSTLPELMMEAHFDVDYGPDF